MGAPGKSAAGRPAFVLACCAAVILGTVGAWNLFEGPGAPRSKTRVPEPPTASREPSIALPGSGAEAHEQHRQYTLAIERALVASDPRQRETAFTMLLPELLAADPASAVRMLNHQPPGEVRDSLRDEMARLWVTLDRESALTWMETLDPAERRAAATGAVRALAAQSPEQAIAAAYRFEVGRDDGSLEYIAQIWAETDLDAARRWAERHAGDERSASLRARIEAVAARGQAGNP